MKVFGSGGGSKKMSYLAIAFIFALLAFYPDLIYGIGLPICKKANAISSCHNFFKMIFHLRHREPFKHILPHLEIRLDGKCHFSDDAESAQSYHGTFELFSVCFPGK